MKKSLVTLMLGAFAMASVALADDQAQRDQSSGEAVKKAESSKVVEKKAKMKKKHKKEKRDARDTSEVSPDQFQGASGATETTTKEKSTTESEQH
jgi:hypothetical protein